MKETLEVNKRLEKERMAVDKLMEIENLIGKRIGKLSEKELSSLGKFDLLKDETDGIEETVIVFEAGLSAKIRGTREDAILYCKNDRIMKEIAARNKLITEVEDAMIGVEEALYDLEDLQKEYPYIIK